MMTLYTYFPLTFFYRITALFLVDIAVGVFVYELFSKNKISKRKAIMVESLVVYISFVLFLAVLSRRSLDYCRFDTDWILYYKAIFIYAIKDSVLEFILNIAVFAPVGTLAYFVFNERRFLYAILTGFVLSCVIEISQLILRCGYVSLLDVIHNTFGTLIGAGIAVALVCLYKKFGLGAKNR